MSFNCGIVGLPNVGKSTLFNALTATAAAQAANFPFCTIEPNIGKVAVPDARLEDIARIAGSEKIIPAQLEFVDIAGLVKGASKGEGLGNQFLSNIRETDAIIHVVRCFEDGDIVHVDGSIDPIRDAETIEIELMLADLSAVDNHIQSLAKKARSNDAEAVLMLTLAEKVKTLLDEGKPARALKIDNNDADEVRAFKMLQLLSAKPVLYVCNVSEDDAATGNEWTEKVATMAQNQNAQAVVICASIESEIAQLDDPAEKKEFLESMNLNEPGLDRIIKAGFTLLGLQSYFTAGPKETRAWIVRIGAKAPEAAGCIHSDFEKGFIKAEIIAFADYLNGGEQGAKEAGKMRQEGKDYTVMDGDIILFRFNV